MAPSPVMPMVMAPGRSTSPGRGELLCGIDLHRRVHHQHGRVEHGHADRREILDRVVAEVAAQCRVDRDRPHRGEEQGVAVGVRLGDVFGRDRAVRARPVLDDDGLSEQSSERSDSRRATKSVVPPAVKATTSLIGRLG